MEMKRYLITMLVLIILLVPSVFAADSSINQQKSAECNYSEYEITISKLKQNITNLTEQINYYKNLSEYYKELYENKNANLTNREIIEFKNNLTVIHQNISNLFQRIENIENRLTIFSLEFGVSIVGGVALIEIVLYFSRKKRHHDKG